MIDFKKLNKEQKLAVSYDKGPLMIVAGAGTGKTAVLTLKIAYLIEKKKVKPEEILGITFTDEAANEMEERIDRILPYSYIDLNISTFHSFAKSVLEENALDIGLSPDFKILDETAVWLFIRENLDKFKLDYYKPIATPTRFIHALVSHFSKCKDYGIYPEDYLNYSKKIKGEESKRIQELAQAFFVYQKLLLKNNFLDFGDLINFTIKLFEKRPLILKRYQEKFKYILVDEFQDTNWIQYQLLKLLAPPQNNLTVCFDDDQAIYRWRGASYNNILQFLKDFPSAQKVILLKNYRSYQNILDLAYRFIQNNNPNRLEHISGLNKKLKSTKRGRGVIEYLHFNNLTNEGNWIVDKIVEILKKDKKTSFNDIAILTRTNDEANYFAGILEKKGLPQRFLASKGLYLKPVILDVISYFKLLDNYHESSAFYRVLNLDVFKIPYEEIVKITNYAKRKSASIYQVLKEPHLIEGISFKTVSKVKFLMDLIEKHTKLIKKGISEVFIGFLEDSGYLKYLIENEKQEEINHLTQFFKKIQGFESLSKEPSLKNFIEKINFELESGEGGKIEFNLEEGPEAIKIMTVHSAKGLEFDYVFLPNLVEGGFPKTERKEAIEIPRPLIKEILSSGDSHLEEERRLFYVALTRTRKGVFLTSLESYEGTRKKKISRFLIEMGLKKEDKKEVGQSIVFVNNKEIEKIKKEKEKTKLYLPPHFSFSQLEAFRNCPLQYKYAFIVQIPTRGNHVYSFGKTMHNVLYRFVKMQDEKKLGLNDLFKIYKEEWIDEWYQSVEQKERYYKLGEGVLRKFYKEFSKKKPKIFKINNEPALEVPFKIKIEDETIIGRIDRIDLLKDGVEIIDYKTGKTKERLSPDEKQQLLIYQIGVKEALGIKPVKLSYYYLEDGKKVSFCGTEEEIQKEKERILKQIEEIKKSDFSPTPGWQCQFCDYRDVCSYAVIVNY